MHDPTIAAPAALPVSRKSRKPSAAEKLAQAAQAAAEVRGYDTNPDVIAYRIERLRARVDRLIWTGLILGLLFTMANVQAFAAGDAPAGSIPWMIAWLLDPMVSLVLVGVLLGEQVIARHSIVAGAWVRRTKWTALLLTYGMNTWQAWAALDPAAILLHSVPPIIVFCAAEAVTTLRLQITEAVHKAYEAAAVRADAATPALARTGPVRVVRRAFTFQPGARTVAVRRAYVFRTPPVSAGQQPVDRDVFVRELTDEILAAAARNDRWGPDYDALIARARRSRSWVEKRVREARTGLIRTEEAAA